MHRDQKRTKRWKYYRQHNLYCSQARASWIRNSYSSLNRVDRRINITALYISGRYGTVYGAFAKIKLTRCQVPRVTFICKDVPGIPYWRLAIGNRHFCPWNTESRNPMASCEYHVPLHITFTGLRITWYACVRRVEGLGLKKENESWPRSETFIVFQILSNSGIPEIPGLAAIPP